MGTQAPIQDVLGNIGQPGALSRAFGDANIQQLLLTLGGAIGGEGSIGAAIGGAGTQYLQGKLEGEAVGRLLAGEDSSTVFGDERFNSLSPEARVRIGTQQRQEDETAIAQRNADSTAVGAQSDMIGALAQDRDSAGLQTSREAQIRQADTQIENQDSQFYDNLESVEGMAAAQNDVSQRISAADNATALAQTDRSVAGQLAAARLQADTSVRLAQIAQAGDRTNTELAIVNSQAQALQGRLESFTLGIQGARAELAGLGVLAPGDPRPAALQRDIQAYEAGQRGVAEQINTIYQGLRTRSGIPSDTPTTPSILTQPRQTGNPFLR